jgi:hypothetical protein
MSFRRRSVNSENYSMDDNDEDKREDFDYGPMQKGITMLKFGQRGPAHEKLFKLSGNMRYITWEGRWFSPKLGKRCVGIICFIDFIFHFISLKINWPSNKRTKDLFDCIPLYINLFLLL